MYPFVARSITNLSAAEAVEELTRMRREHPAEAIVAFVSRTAPPALHAIAAEHADGVQIEEEWRENPENGMDAIKAIVNRFYTSRGVPESQQLDARLMGMVDLGLLSPAEALGASGETIAESDEVGERVLQVIEPLLITKAGPPDFLASCGMLVWNCPLLPRDERDEVVRRFGEMLATDGNVELGIQTMRVLVQRRRDLFPNDARFIIDCRADVLGNEFRIQTTVMQRPQAELTEFADEAPAPLPPPRMSDHIISGPLVAHTSREHDALIRRTSREDRSLSKALQSLVDTGRHADADPEKFQMVVILAAIAWNATQLSPSEERRVITELCTRLGSSGVVMQGVMMTFAATKRARFADDRRLIAHCTMRGKPGNYRITARRWPDGFPLGDD